MKSAHRRAHLVIWLLLAPTMAAILYYALHLRPTEPINDALPAAIETEQN
jgi:hypothetical protein